MAAAESLRISPLIDPDHYAAHGYPHELWTRLRREDPVHRVEQNPEMPFWAITKHADIGAIGKAPDKFLNGPTLLIRTEPQPDDGMFPQIFGRLNRHGVPGPGLVIVGVLMTIVLFATMSPTIADQFSRIIDLAVILIVIPYIYSAVAMVKVAFDHGLPPRTFQTYKWIAIAAVIYCLWTVIGGDPSTVVNAMVALLISVPLYPFFLRSMEAAAERKRARSGSAGPDATTLKAPGAAGASQAFPQ